MEPLFMGLVVGAVLGFERSLLRVIQFALLLALALLAVIAATNGIERAFAVLAEVNTRYVRPHGSLIAGALLGVAIGGSVLRLLTLRAR